MRCRASNRYVADLFAIIGGDHGRVALDFTKCDASRSSRAQSRPAHRLSRFDLFHAHAFADADTLTVGLLFHASEYPAFDAKAFPHELGFCQTDSKCAYDEGKHARRNVLWVARARGTKEDLGEGRMEKKAPVDVAFAALDTTRGSENGSNPLHDTLLSVRELHTTFEGDFGNVAGDLLYLHELPDRKPKHRVFAFAR